MSPRDVSTLTAFRRWFRNSRVVDRRGAPLVVYHGTHKDFEAFDANAIGDNFRADERGFFFTSSPREASNYAENDTVGMSSREGANVMPVYVALQRPLVIDPAFLQREGMGGLLGPGGQEDTISFWDTYQSLILEWADECRADGVIVVDPAFTEDNGEPRRLVVAFSPIQIKSAIGNSGAFNPKSPSLTDAPGTAPAKVRRRAAPRHDDEALRL